MKLRWYLLGAIALGSLTIWAGFFFNQDSKTYGLNDGIGDYFIIFGVFIIILMALISIRFRKFF